MLREKLSLRKNMEQKEIINMNEEEIKYSMTPIGKAHINVPKKDEEDKIKQGYKKCTLCGKLYNSKNSGKHKKTKYHQIHADLNSKLKKILLN